MEIEGELRRILGKYMCSKDPSRIRGKFLTTRLLFRSLASKNPRFQQMRSSFDYVLEVCNAAIHAQRIAEGVAIEAVGMGLQILRELKLGKNP